MKHSSHEIAFHRIMYALHENWKKKMKLSWQGKLEEGEDEANTMQF